MWNMSLPGVVSVGEFGSVLSLNPLGPGKVVTNSSRVVGCGRHCQYSHRIFPLEAVQSDICW